MTDQTTGELPLTLHTGEGSAVIHDANGIEVVPWMPSDWEDEPGVEYFPQYAQTLVKYYEEPEELLSAEQPYMEGRPVYGSGEHEEDLWFEAEELPESPNADAEAVGCLTPFSVVVDDTAPFPNDTEKPPDHEVRIEDAKGDVWYQVAVEECDGLHSEKATETVAAFTTALRLAYERPGVFVTRYKRGC